MDHHIISNMMLRWKYQSPSSKTTISSFWWKHFLFLNLIVEATTVLFLKKCSTSYFCQIRAGIKRLGRLNQTSIRLEVECVLMWTNLSGLARAEAIILVLFGKDGHLTNIMEQCSFSQKYLPFPPFERGSPHFGQSTMGFSSGMR